MRYVMVALLHLAAYSLLMGGDVRGKVTYVASGAIYTSLGTESGIRDSTMLYVVKGRDTLAILRVTAVSSKSSSADVVSGRAKIAVGDIVVAAAERMPVGGIARAHAPDAAIAADSLRPDSVRLIGAPTVVAAPAVMVRGRISAQYSRTVYDDPTTDATQPAVVVNLKAAARDIPLEFEMYANYRTLSYGNAKPFSAGSIDQSRLYRFALQYGVGVYAATAGRFTPSAAPSVGYIDGLLLSRSFGRFLFGAGAGFQSKPTLNGLNTAYKKMAFFASYHTQGEVNLTASAAYVRNYFHFNLDREVVSATANMYTVGGMGVYFNSDIDLRQKKGGDFVLSPSITNLHASIGMPVVEFLSVSLGGDVSRSYADYSLIKYLPDSLLDHRARTGVSFGFQVFPASGVNFANTYTPRSSEDGFGREYSNVSSLVLSNLLSTGVMLRANAILSANQYSSSKGAGCTIERSFFESVQLSYAYQRSASTIISLQESDINTSNSVDALWLVTRDLSLSADYTRYDAFGRVSTNMFAELSLRF